MILIRLQIAVEVDLLPLLVEEGHVLRSLYLEDAQDGAFHCSAVLKFQCYDIIFTVVCHFSSLLY